MKRKHTRKPTVKRRLFVIIRRVTRKQYAEEDFFSLHGRKPFNVSNFTPAHMPGA